MFRFKQVKCQCEYDPLLNLIWDDRLLWCDEENTNIALYVWHWKGETLKVQVLWWERIIFFEKPNNML